MTMFLCNVQYVFACGLAIRSFTTQAEFSCNQEELHQALFCLNNLLDFYYLNDHKQKMLAKRGREGGSLQSEKSQQNLNNNL